MFYETVPNEVKPYLNNFINIIEFEEWENKGMLHHEYKVITADIDCPNADYILHLDSDCIFTSKTNVENFFENNKPILYYSSFENLVILDSNIINWKYAVENALGWSPDYEFMRSRFLTYKRTLYPKVRELIENHTKQSVDEYVKKQRNEYPQTFAEYPTLGEVAWKFLHDDYFWINVDRHEHLKFMERDKKIRQMWSHGPPTNEDVEILNKLGLNYE